MEEEGGGVDEDAVVVGEEGEVRGDEATKVVLIQTWNLWLGAEALEEVGTGGVMARRVTELAGRGDMAEGKEAITKKEMMAEETQEM